MAINEYNMNIYIAVKLQDHMSQYSSKELKFQFIDHSFIT